MKLSKFISCFGAGNADAERFGAIAEQHQRFGPLVDQLIIFLGREKDDVIFLDHPLAAFEIFNRALALDHQKRLRILMKMHRRVVARLEVKHPRAKIVRAEEMAIFDLLLRAHRRSSARD